jgi:hypothetical protein
MDKDTADNIINCLESGVVPIDYVKYFSAGRENEIELIKNLLFETECGNSGLLFVHGDYGIGKTHILALALNYALERKFLASHITLTSRECPLSRLNDVYRNILTNLCFSDQKHKSGFYSFLESWLSFTTKKVLSHKDERCKHGLTYETCGFGCLDELYAKYIPELWKVDSDFRSAVKLFQYAELRGNLQLKDCVLRWLLGERLKQIDIKWMNKQLGAVKIQSNISDDNAFLMLKNISQFSRIMGFNGLLILLDEAERIPSIQRIADGYINLINLIIKSIKMSGVLFIYATTPQFYDDARRYLKNFESDKTKDLLELVYKRMENEKLKLIPLPPTELEMIAEKIFEIYLVSQGDEYHPQLMHQWQKMFSEIKKICQENQTMRDFIGKIMTNIKNMENARRVKPSIKNFLPIHTKLL